VPYYHQQQGNRHPTQLQQMAEVTAAVHCASVTYKAAGIADCMAAELPLHALCSSSAPALPRTITTSSISNRQLQQMAEVTAAAPLCQI
jgi:hypothetical protein